MSSIYCAGDPSYPESDPAYMLRIFTTTPQQYAAVGGALKKKGVELNATVYVQLDNATDFTFWKAGEYHQQVCCNHQHSQAAIQL
jgi:peptide methionine sulfoxide reductase MsrA